MKGRTAQVVSVASGNKAAAAEVRALGLAGLLWIVIKCPDTPGV